MQPRIMILGDGAWGTALAHCLAERYPITLWCHNADVAHSIQTNRKNILYLPNIMLHSDINAVTDLSYAQQATHIILAIPVRYLRSVLMALKNYVSHNSLIIVASKGIEASTCMLSTDIIEDVLNIQNYAVLSGPSYARELVQYQPTRVLLAGQDHAKLIKLQQMLTLPYLSFDIADDYRGVQVCGAYKNCIALGVGILEGLGYGDNTKTFFIMRALTEMKQLIEYYKGNATTLYSDAGIGDTILTALGKQSKNRNVGVMVGQSKSLSKIMEQFPILPEGITTVQSLHQLSVTTQLSLPIITILHAILYQEQNPNKLLSVLTQ